MSPLHLSASSGIMELEVVNLLSSCFRGKLVDKKILKWKKISRPMTVGLLTSSLAIVAFFGTTSNLHAASSTNQTTDHCSLGTLKGRYIFSDTGFTIIGSKQIPFADAGQETYDGNGHVRGVSTQSINGKISRLVNYSGTYTVNSQCIGTYTVTDTTGFTTHFDQFIASDGSKLTYVETDPGMVSASPVLETRVSN
jgi:hypothetical protein